MRDGNFGDVLKQSTGMGVTRAKNVGYASFMSTTVHGMIYIEG